MTDLSLLADDLLRLATIHHIAVEWTDSWERATTYVGRHPTAFLPKVESLRDYLIGLHELGHAADPLAASVAGSDCPYEMVLAEGAAWAWAAAHVHPAAAAEVHGDTETMVTLALAFGSHLRDQLASPLAAEPRCDTMRPTSPHHPR